MSTPGGETLDSCVVWLPQHKILFSGNTFGPLFPHFPNFNTLRGDRYRYADNYLHSLQRIQALQPELLITGHFEPIAGAALINDSLNRLHGAVSHVHEQALAGMNAGTDIWTLMRTIQLPPELYVGEGYGKVSWAVRTFWESYVGWFHLRSSTELYPQQADSVYGDLVELAGIDAVVQRGRQKLSQHDNVEAMHLAEAALAFAPDHPAAITLQLDAHRQQLADRGGSNFWERGWLQSRINLLTRQLEQ